MPSSESRACRVTLKPCPRALEARSRSSSLPLASTTARATEVWRQQQAARPLAARWLSGTVGGMSFDVGGKNPIADVVYQWLAHDLQRLGLTGPLAGHSRDRTRTVWEREG